MQFRFIRRRAGDEEDEISDMEMGIDVAHVGVTIAAAEPGKQWKIVEIDPSTDPPTMIAELVDE